MSRIDFQGVIMIRVNVKFICSVELQDLAGFIEDVSKLKPIFAEGQCNRELSFEVLVEDNDYLEVMKEINRIIDGLCPGRVNKDDMIIVMAYEDSHEKN